MRKSVTLAAAVLSIFGTPALANDPAPADAKSVALSPFPKLASLVEPDETPESGDMIAMNRPFASWMLRCDYRLSQNKRLCSVEQRATDGRSSVVWRIANSVDNRAMVVISADPRMVSAKGLRMSFSDLEKTIPEKEWLCGPNACITAFVFEGFLQAAIVNSSSIRFGYWIKADSGEESRVDLTGSMAGFSLALKTGATDPFGKTAVQVPPAAKAESKPDPKPVAKEEPKAEKVTDKPAERHTRRHHPGERSKQSDRDQLY